MGKSSKGASWERDVCKDLSKWIQGTTKPYLFWRGRGSGATFTQDGLVGESFAGDLYPVNMDGRFLTDKVVIECKSGYPTASIDKHLKYGKDDKILSFWQQVNEDASKTNKSPMLIYKKKGQSPWLGINKYMYQIFINYLANIRHIVISWDSDIEIDDLYFIDMKEFFDIITPQIFKDNLCID